jgi:hypothetical protein
MNREVNSSDLLIMRDSEADREIDDLSDYQGCNE